MKEGNKNATVSMQCIINHREQLTKHHLSTSGLIPQPQSYVNDRLESFMTAFFLYNDSICVHPSLFIF